MLCVLPRLGDACDSCCKWTTALCCACTWLYVSGLMRATPVLRDHGFVLRVYVIVQGWLMRATHSGLSPRLWHARVRLRLWVARVRVRLEIAYDSCGMSPRLLGYWRFALIGVASSHLFINESRRSFTQLWVRMTWMVAAVLKLHWACGCFRFCSLSPDVES